MPNENFKFEGYYFSHLEDYLDLSGMYYNNPNNWYDETEKILPKDEISKIVGVRCVSVIEPGNTLRKHIDSFVPDFPKNNNLSKPLEIAFKYRFKKGIVLRSEDDKKKYSKDLFWNIVGLYLNFISLNPSIERQLEKFKNLLKNIDDENFIMPVTYIKIPEAYFQEIKKDIEKIDSVGGLSTPALDDEYKFIKTIKEHIAEIIPKSNDDLLKRKLIKCILLFKLYNFVKEREYRDVIFHKNIKGNNGFFDNNHPADALIIFLKIEEYKGNLEILKKLINQAIELNIYIEFPSKEVKENILDWAKKNNCCLKLLKYDKLKVDDDVRI